MRILINALYLIPGAVGGTETYIRALIEALVRNDTENQYILCVDSNAAATFKALPPNWRVVSSPTPSTNRPARLFVEQTWLPRLADSLRVDVIHSGGYTTPLVSRAKRLTVIHDMNYCRHPEDMSALERLIYRILIPQAARRSHRIVTVSNAARLDIQRWTGVSAAKIEVISHAPRERWPGDASHDEHLVKSYGIAEPYVLGVAASYPHKNMLRLIEAFPLFARARGAVQLVLTGHAGRAEHAIQHASSDKQASIRRLGWVDDTLLAALYRRSEALVFPSLYEGFGLPIVEAMALGTPVVTSNFGAMLEIADDAAELVDPYDVSSIKRGVQHVVDDGDRREELRRRGRHRAAMFSWDTAAQETMAAYTRVAEGTTSRAVGSERRKSTN